MCQSDFHNGERLENENTPAFTGKTLWSKCLGNSVALGLICNVLSPSKCYKVPLSARHAVRSWWCQDAQTQAPNTEFSSQCFISFGEHITVSLCSPFQYMLTGLSVFSPHLCQHLPCSSSWRICLMSHLSFSVLCSWPISQGYSSPS